MQEVYMHWVRCFVDCVTSYCNEKCGNVKAVLMLFKGFLQILIPLRA